MEEEKLYQLGLIGEQQQTPIKLILLPMKKRSKFVSYGRVEMKLPRFLKNERK